MLGPHGCKGTSCGDALKYRGAVFIAVLLPHSLLRVSYRELVASEERGGIVWIWNLIFFFFDPYFYSEPLLPTITDR